MAKPKMYRSELKKILDLHKRPNGETDEEIVGELDGMYEMPQAMSFEDGILSYEPKVSQGLMNIPRSFGDSIMDLAHMVSGSGLGESAKYGLGMGQSARQTLTGQEPLEKYNQIGLYEQGTQQMIDRYRNLGQTAYEDPFGLYLDVAPVVGKAAKFGGLDGLARIGKLDPTAMAIEGVSSITNKIIDGLRKRNTERARHVDQRMKSIETEYRDSIEGGKLGVEAISTHPTLLEIRRKIAARKGKNSVLKDLENAITTAGNMGDELLRVIDTITDPVDAGEAMIRGLQEFKETSKAANRQLYEVFQDGNGTLTQVPATLENFLQAIEDLQQYTPELKRRDFKKESVKAALNNETVKELLQIQDEFEAARRVEGQDPEVVARQEHLWQNYPRPEVDTPDIRTDAPTINMELLWELRGTLDDVIEGKGGYGITAFTKTQINTNTLLKQLRSALSDDIHLAAEVASDIIDETGGLRDHFVEANRAYSLTRKRLESKVAEEIRAAAFSNQPERLNKILLSGDQVGFGGEPWLANSEIKPLFNDLGQEVVDKVQQNILIQIVEEARKKDFSADSIQGQIDAINKNSPGRLEELLDSPFDEIRGEDLVKRLKDLSHMTGAIERIAKVKGSPAPGYGLSDYLKFRVAEDLITKLLKGQVNNAMMASVSMVILGGSRLYQDFLHAGLRKKFIDKADIGRGRRYPLPEDVALLVRKAGVPVARVGRVVGRAGKALEEIAAEQEDREFHAYPEGVTPGSYEDLEFKRTLRRPLE